MRVSSPVTVHTIFCLSVVMSLVATPSLSQNPIAIEASGVWVNPVATEDSDYSGVGSSSIAWGEAASGSSRSTLSFSGDRETVFLERAFPLGRITFGNGRTYSGTGITGISLNLSVRVSGIEVRTVQPFSLKTTINLDTNNATQNADSITLKSQGTSIVSVDGVEYKLSILGFMVVGSGNGSSPRMHTLSAFEDSVVQTKLWAILSRGDCVGPLMYENIFLGFDCPPGGNGGRWTATSKVGEGLYGSCQRGEYTLCYSSPEGALQQVGRCPYKGGCNYKSFMFVVNEQNEKVCFHSSDWQSLDAQTDDDGDGLLDIAKYRARMSRPPVVTSSVDEWRYSPAGPLFICSQSVPTSLQNPDGQPPKPIGEGAGCGFVRGATPEPTPLATPSGEPMTEVGIKVCDLDRDNDCDRTDKDIFDDARDSCQGASTYLQAADFDRNGCVDVIDEYFLFGQDADLDEVPDAADNCHGRFNPRQEDSDGNGIGDLCEGIFVDNFETGGTGAWSQTTPNPTRSPTSAPSKEELTW